MIERRIVRSPEPKTAIYLYLLHKAQKLGLSALALASGEGLLITGTRGDARVDLDQMAALSPSLANDEDVSGSLLPQVAIDAACVEVAGESFYLAGVGGLPRISEVKETLSRILS